MNNNPNAFNLAAVLKPFDEKQTKSGPKLKHSQSTMFDQHEDYYGFISTKKDRYEVKMAHNDYYSSKNNNKSVHKGIFQNN